MQKKNVSLKCYYTACIRSTNMTKDVFEIFKHDISIGYALNYSKEIR